MQFGGEAAVWQIGCLKRQVQHTVSLAGTRSDHKNSSYKIIQHDQWNIHWRPLNAMETPKRFEGEKEKSCLLKSHALSIAFFSTLDCMKNSRTHTHTQIASPTYGCAWLEGGWKGVSIRRFLWSAQTGVNGFFFLSLAYRLCRQSSAAKSLRIGCKPKLFGMSTHIATIQKCKPSDRLGNGHRH